MKKTCIDTPQANGTTYLHPLYLTYINISHSSTGKTHSCPTPYFMEDGALVGLEFVDKNHVVDTQGPQFDIHALLYITYGISTLSDAIQWTHANIKKYTSSTLDRVWDMVWEVVVTKEDLNNMATLDNLVSTYQLMVGEGVSYGVIEKALLEIGKKYLGSKLTYHSSKSFQKKIKKSINSYID